VEEGMRGVRREGEGTEEEWKRRRQMLYEEYC
jgi:hypothetical protein